MGKISIEGIEIYAHHGYYQEEQALGSRFLINLELVADTSKAEKSDDLNDTVNYQEVYEVIKVQMQIKSKLLENIAARILDEVLLKFPLIYETSIKITKLSPPINGKIDGVSVEVSRKRK